MASQIIKHVTYPTPNETLLSYEAVNPTTRHTKGLHPQPNTFLPNGMPARRIGTYCKDCDHDYGTEEAFQSHTDESGKITILDGWD